MGDFYKNPEACSGTRDGTSTRQPINKNSDYRPLVYICSPYSDDPPGNTRKVIRYSRFAVDEGVIPLAPHLLLPLYIKEETERELALSMDMAFLDCCQELWCFGRNMTKGMKAEVKRARELGIRIRYFTEECIEED